MRYKCPQVLIEEINRIASANRNSWERPNRGHTLGKHRLTILDFFEAPLVPLSQRGVQKEFRLPVVRNLVWECSILYGGVQAAIQQREISDPINDARVLGQASLRRRVLRVDMFNVCS